MINTETKKTAEEEYIPVDLKNYLISIADNKSGYTLGKPWKYSEDSLGVVIPILRENVPDRNYITMYEVLKDLGLKDTGSINHVEFQNKTGKAIFIRAGTIFTGTTQNRASQYSGVYTNKKENIDVRCVNQSYGIRSGTEMKFGDIAPPSVTINLMYGNQNDVWDSVRNYTSASRPTPAQIEEYIRNPNKSIVMPEGLPEGLMKQLKRCDWEAISRHGDYLGVQTYTTADGGKKTRITKEKPTEDVVQLWSGELSDKDIGTLKNFVTVNNINACGDFDNSRRRPSHSSSSSTYESTSDLLGHLQEIKKGQSLLDDMMQKVPLFQNQVGAIIFNPVGVVAVETFDHPKSWEAIKKEIIEKYGDKIKQAQSEHLFELKPETILPAFRKFIDSIDKFVEKTVRKDEYSETRIVHGEDIVGEYTLVKGQPIHILLLKKNT